MLGKILAYGGLAGLIVGAVGSGLTIAMADNPPDMSVGMLIGYATMLVALSAVFVAIKRHRDRDLGGVIRFLPALGLGLGVSAVAGIIYALAWEATLQVTGMDYGAKYAEHIVAVEEAKGVAGEALERVKADAAKFQAQYANPLIRMPMTFAEIFPVGLLVSLASAGLLRNSRFLPTRRA